MIFALQLTFRNSCEFPLTALTVNSLTSFALPVFNPCESADWLLAARAVYKFTVYSVIHWLNELNYRLLPTVSISIDWFNNVICLFSEAATSRRIINIACEAAITHIIILKVLISRYTRFNVNNRVLLVSMAYKMSSKLFYTWFIRQISTVWLYNVCLQTKQQQVLLYTLTEAADRRMPAILSPCIHFSSANQLTNLPVEESFVPTFEVNKDQQAWPMFWPNSKIPTGRLKV